MKIAIVIDKPGSAIDRLSQMVRDHNKHLNIRINYLHPKRPSDEQIEYAKESFEWCDILHVAYWKSGEKLQEFVSPGKFEEKKKLLMHYNPYSIIDEPEVNKKYETIVVGNQQMHLSLPRGRLVNYAVDLDFFKYNEDYNEDSNIVNMVVGRIEGKKGIKEVARACKELGYEFHLVGKISKPDYFKEIMKANPETKFFENATEEVLKDEYYKAAVHVCNSVDFFESGTLPILEALACGVPVLTRVVGHVPDLYSEDGQNLYLRNGEQNDMEDLKTTLKELMVNPMLRKKIREKGWKTVKSWGAKDYAMKIEKIYYEVYRNLDATAPFVSVIMPTKDRPKVLAQSLVRAIAQDYPYMEIVVVDSGDVPVPMDEIIKVIEKEADDDYQMPPIKYIHFKNHGEFTLPKARNIGVMEASGDLLVFCDERVGMHVSAVSEFVKRWEPKIWSWGIKDNAEKGFVENLSCIAREDFVAAGMFNERIDVWGGCTQEIRTRFERFQGVNFQLVKDAKADGLANSGSGKNRKQNTIEAKLKVRKLYEK